MKTETKYFQFSKSIPWKYKYGKVLIPSVNGELFNYSLIDKVITVIANGGLLESYFSLAIFEALHFMNPIRELYWEGNQLYLNLLKYNNLAKPTANVLGQKFVERYPVPLFFDKLNNAYFNCLNNYINVKTFNLKYFEQSRDPVLKQIFSNALIPWDIDYIPKLRTFKYNSEEFNIWSKSNRFYINRPFVLIIPDKSYSIHDVSCMDWSIHEIKAFAAILQNYGIAVVIPTLNKAAYYDSPFICTAPPTLEFILPLMENSSLIISKEIDFLLLGLLISKAKLAMLDLKKNVEFNLNFNKIYIGRDNDIYVKKQLKPIELLNFISRR